MAKFKVGDRVRVIRDGLGHGFEEGYEGVLEEVRETYNEGQRLKMDGMWVSGDVETATPTEHPALTLAKAEVVRLMNIGPGNLSDGAYQHLCFMERLLLEWGLRYQAKPVVPQPVEYDFFPIEPEQGA